MGKTAKKIEYDVVHEKELKSILELQKTISAARAMLKERELQLEGMEKQMIVRLKSGAVVEGNFEVIVKTVKGACRPGWKDEYLNHMLNAHGQVKELSEELVRSRTEIKQEDKLIIGPRFG